MTTQFVVEQVDGHTFRVAASVLKIDTDKQLYEFSDVGQTFSMKLPMREVKAITTPPQTDERPPKSHMETERAPLRSR